MFRGDFSLLPDPIRPLGEGIRGLLIEVDTIFLGDRALFRLQLAVPYEEFGERFWVLKYRVFFISSYKFWIFSWYFYYYL